MRTFRRIMLSGGLDIDSLPETRKLYYNATSIVNPKSGSLGSAIIMNNYNNDTGEGVIVCYDDILQIDQSAFASKSNLVKIIIPKSVTTIGEDAFRSCYNLEQVIIQTACHIGSFAFRDTSLSYINIPKGTTFGQSCFLDDDVQNRRERTVYFEGSIEDWVRTYFWNAASNPLYEAVSSASQKPSILYINGNIAENISISYIDYASFYNCGSLKSVIIEGDANIPSHAFNNCVNLAEITLPNAPLTIGSYAFNKCESLKHVIYKGELENWLDSELNDTPLSYCEEFYMGKNKESLIDITIPNTITQMKSNILEGCPKLQSVTFHSNVSKLDNYSLANLHLLKYCDFSNHITIPNLIDSRAFSKIPTTCKIIVPDVLYNEWIAATNWSFLASHIIKKSDWDASQVTE